MAKYFRYKLIRVLDLQITVYPHELNIREGKEASFECRARTSDANAYPEGFPELFCHFNCLNSLNV
jgi:hypothetical protein